MNMFHKIPYLTITDCLISIIVSVAMWSAALVGSAIFGKVLVKSNEQ